MVTWCAVSHMLRFGALGRTAATHPIGIQKLVQVHALPVPGVDTAGDLWSV